MRSRDQVQVPAPVSLTVYKHKTMYRIGFLCPRAHSQQLYVLFYSYIVKKNLVEVVRF